MNINMRYLDSSVAMRVLLQQSDAALKWLDKDIENGGYWFSSQLLKTELYRTYWRIQQDFSQIDEFISSIPLIEVDNELLNEAALLEPIVKTLDALHLATARRLTKFGSVTLITHDAQMARANEQLGLDVHDPVTDDPNRGSVV